MRFAARHRSGFLLADPCEMNHKVGPFWQPNDWHEVMQTAVAPLFLFMLCSTALVVGLLTVSWLIGPKREGAVKQMPYESGMDPIHDTRRRFDVRFNLVAIAFLVFDVELLFLYPWAVASRPSAAGGVPRGIDAAVAAGWVESRGLVFAEVMVFIALLGMGFLYAWRKGVFRWR
jgi:NADH-quinone oxidoreductase subunit A